MPFSAKTTAVLTGLAGLALAVSLACPALAAPPNAPEPKAPAAAGQPRPAGAAAATPLTPTLAPSQAQANALAAKVQARYQQVTGLAADYQRKSVFVATGQDVERTVEGGGRLLWSRPLSLKLEQDQPRRENIIAHNGQVWWVRPERGRADLYPLDRFTSDLRSLLDALGGLTKVDEAFVVEPAAAGEAPEGEEGMTLALKPKESRVDIKRLVLWFDGQEMLIKGFRITSLIGDVTEYRFSQTQANPRLGADAFVYAPPVDYKLTDHRPNQGQGH
jgi:outer membrane lipoprotein-sorting protein